MNFHTCAQVAHVASRLRRRGDPDSLMALAALLGLSEAELELLAQQEAGR